MAQLELNLDAFLASRLNFGLKDLSMPGVATIALMSGVDGLSITFDSRSKSFSEHDLALLAQCSGSARFNVHISPRADLVQAAQDLKVDQVTFIGDDLFKTYGSDLENFIPQLKETGKLVSFRVDPELGELKKAYRLRADFIELNVAGFTTTASAEARMEAQEQIALLARTAEKNGMGVALNGSIGYQEAPALINIEAVENLIVGRSIMARAVFVGLESAIRDFKGSIL